MRRLPILPALVMLAAMATSGCSGARYADAPPLPFEDIDYGFEVDYALQDPRVAFIDEGEGERTLLLVHGLASNAGFWRYNIPAFAEAGYRVVAVDLPGFGKSEKGPYPYDMAFYADVLARLIEAERLGPVVLVGHSMGGQIGITLALERPELVERLVLAAPAGIEAFQPGEGQWLANALTAEGTTRATEDAVRRNLVMNFYRWRDEWEWMVEERVRMARTAEMEEFSYAVIRSVHGMIDQPTTALLPRLGVPALIVYGRYDGLIPNPYLHPGTPRAVFERGAELIPRARLVEIDRAGHMLQIERPEAFNRAVLEDLRRQGV